MKTLRISNKALAKAATIINNGGVVICPTDTVYGFLADATNKKAVAKIYKIKKRPRSKLLSLFVKDFKTAKSLAEINGTQAKILRKFWPGKYTFILNRKKYLLSNSIELDSKINGKITKIYGIKKDTIALRITNHPFLQKLLKKINRPLVQTSVNISGKPPMIRIEDIIKKFGKNKNIFIINAGNLKKNNPSKIIDLTREELTVLR